MAASPTQRTLDHCRAKGCRTLQVVEVWNPHSRTRRDLFGFIDVLVCVPGAGILGIQATSLDHVKDRRDKAMDDDHLPHLRDWLESGGGFEVWGWGKRRKSDTTYTLVREEITLDDLKGLPTC